jgi:hypothetical protein
VKAFFQAGVGVLLRDLRLDTALEIPIECLVPAPPEHFLLAGAELGDLMLEVDDDAVVLVDIEEPVFELVGV